MYRKQVVRSLVYLGFLPTTHGVGFGADSPLNGNYTTSYHHSIGLEEAQSKCGLNFFHSESDGRFVTYSLDLERFLQRKTILYVVSGRGACDYDGITRMERCVWVPEYAEEAASPVWFFSLYTHISSDSADGITFFDEQAMKDFARSKNDEDLSKGETNKYYYYRCADLRKDVISRYLSSGRNPLTKKQMDKLFTRIEDPVPGDYEIGRKVLEQINAAQ